MNPSYILEYLRQDNPPSAGMVLGCEFRLLCSGNFEAGSHPDRNILSRVLLNDPFRLFVAAPIMADPSKIYPQELALRFSVAQVHETTERMDNRFHPHWEIASDFVAIMTLLCRRLITIAGLVSETVDVGEIGLPDWMREMPAPLATALKMTYWERQPSVLITYPDKAEVRHFQPLIQRIDGDRVARLLKALPLIAHAERVVLAARLYWSAMAWLYERPDIAYVLMTMSVEALANEVVSAADARAEAKKAVPKRIRTKLTALGLSEDQIRGAWEAMAEGRSTFKFACFMDEYVTDALWQPDDLFPGSSRIPGIAPTKDRFGDAVKAVYLQRNQFVHHGKPYPMMITVGLGTMMHSRAGTEIVSGVRFPPLAWFERAVHLALVNYIERHALQAQVPEGLSSESKHTL